MDYMIKKLYLRWLQGAKEAFKIWSAACSSGEEPYSIAILLTEEGYYNKYNIEIYGTDINNEVINIGEKGIYRAVSFRGVPPSIIEKYFIKNGLDYILNLKLK